MDVGLEAARKKSYKTCCLKVWEGDKRAIEFYTHKGFSRIGSEPYPVESASRRVVLMACPLK
jgi:hypothetical protein